MPRVIRRWIEEEEGGGRCVNRPRCGGAALFLVWWQFGPTTGCARSVCLKHAEAYAKKWDLPRPSHTQLDQLGMTGDAMLRMGHSSSPTLILPDEALRLGRAVRWAVELMKQQRRAS